MRFIPPHRHNERAFATAAVFILLLAASALMLTTAATFRNLHRELRFVDEKQVEHWNATTPSSGSETITNAISKLPPP